MLVLGPKRMTTGYLHVSRVNALQKPTTRSEESIVERREVQIKHLLDTAAVKDWNKRMRSRQERQSCVGDLLMTRTRRSRGGVREFATYKDPSVFVAAPDVDNTSLIDLLTVKRGCSIMCFDAVAAFCQALETQLIFIEALAEHRAKVGQHLLWQCLKVREGRRKGARAWQDHFVDILLAKGCLGAFKQSLKSPTIFSSSSRLHWTCM